MQISVKQSIVAETGLLADRFARQVTFATARALTITAIQARKDAQTEIRRVFDRPTPWIVNAVRYSMTTKAQVSSGNAQARVYINDQLNKNGAAPTTVLAPQLMGGTRSMKRFERAFMALGLMTQGEALVPARGRGELLDAYGNVRSALIVQLLSYFQAFGESGYRANATVKRRTSMAKHGRSERGYKTINGKVYFWSRGPGHWSGAGSWQHGRDQHLQRGIWEKSGIHGGNVKPVLLVVPHVNYRARFDFVGVVKATVARMFGSTFAQTWREAKASAR